MAPIKLAMVGAGSRGTGYARPTPSGIQALRSGPYGRCVYACDNDVVGPQVVSLESEQGTSCAFTMTALNRSRNREIRIFGTRAELYGDGSVIEVSDFLPNSSRSVDTNAADSSILGGHGGGDSGLMKCFVEAVATGSQDRVLSGVDESLETHFMVFAAEQARRQGSAVSLDRDV